MEYLYRANDGTIFYDEDECVNYEAKLKYNLKIFNGVRLWDENDEEIPIGNIFSDNFNLMDVWSIYFPNREIAKQFRKMMKDIYNEEIFSCDIRDVFGHDIYDVDKGLYIFNENSDYWVQIDKSIKEIALRVKSLDFTLNYELNPN